jgi:uncharacterized DUF497 family protein
MKISFDPAKRDWTLQERGLAFEDAEFVLRGPVYERPDLRVDYGESRIQTFGYLEGRMVVIVWTLRGDVHHIISMRKANGREVKANAPKIFR